MKKRLILLATAISAVWSCSVREIGVQPDVLADKMPIGISGAISQQYVTKVDDGGFCNLDVVGIYVVDYDGSTPGSLKVQGNRADNLMFTFDETVNKWVPAHDIYWKDKHTHIDIYGYYPYGTPQDVDAYEFEVREDQHTTSESGHMGGYEASDFLWGKATDIAPTSSLIDVQFNHMLANVRITLEEGSGFTDGEWVSLKKDVMIQNTIRAARINLNNGKAVVSDAAAPGAIVAMNHGSDYRAIVVPQTVKAGVNLISVSLDGESYFLTKTEDMVFAPSKQHNFTLTVNKRSNGSIDLVLETESITVWENDPESHNAIAREYVVVNVPEPGTLAECIAASGKEITKVRNLKLTGQINSRDMAVMRFKMDRLSALNMKEVEIVAGEGGSLDLGQDYLYNEAGEIPNHAFNSKKSLTFLVLPDKLKKIGGEIGGNRGAFFGCDNLSGSLIIPEGVVEIGPGAFNGCTNFTGQLILPSTLKVLGRSDFCLSPYHDGVFKGCNFVCEVKLPEGLEILGAGTFYECKGLYGDIRLPDGLKGLGEGAFAYCENLSGSVVIPQGITIVPNECFRGTNLGGTLTLHDGVISIGNGAFRNAGLRGELSLPANLDVISDYAFYGCDFTGNLILPKGLYTIGEKAFSFNWRLYGMLEIPDNVTSIGPGAFAQCGSIEGVTFPANLESIRYANDFFGDGGAFQDCFGIGRIVCKGTVPPIIQPGALSGVAKDNFTLEVPESAVQQYQAAPGWCEFKRISAYRNLVIRPSMATAINTSVTRELVLTADDDWYVAEQPDWVTLDKTSGTGKTAINLTFAQMPAGSPAREGDVVFMLNGKDYKTRCHVTQYDYEYAEDQFITLQSSSKANGLNIVILGDGFSAKDVSEGALLEHAREAYDHFFSIEPYKTYKEYFNVYTAVSVSPESGVGSVNTIVYNRFNTTAKGGVSLGGRNGESDINFIAKYAQGAPTVNSTNISQALVIMLPNTYDYGGICYMYDEGFAVAYCPMSDYGYPLDFRGVVQHEAGGHGFGKLGDEYIYHNAFIDNCTCICCPHDWEFNQIKAKGWFENLSLSGKFSEVPWSHLIFHPKYSGFVDVFEGGYMHNRGVYRSEQNSCMNNDIPYYSTISRESIVKRIKAMTGEQYSFEDFVEKDVVEVDLDTKASSDFHVGVNVGAVQHEPVFMGSFFKN